ncbi:ATP-binding protein, partial [Candidatus Micrarchaeota archaeon]|nr:ATP-binding protein [Candidatus Micrarchaeota archaeon]
MILKDTLRRIVKDQMEELSAIEKGTEREILNEIDVNLPYATIISGIRRCGKSTLLRQLMQKTPSFYYFNFEDPRAINFELSDFQKLNDVFLDVYGKSEHYFFDEIQNAPKWELFVRSMLDKKKKFVITGSNSSMLSKELGSRLTGRHLRQELFPFSFKEMLAFTGKTGGIEAFEEYINTGGFPEYLRYKRNEILQELFNDIIARDVVVARKLRNEKIVKEMAAYLITNTGKEFSYSSLAKLFKLGSVNSAVSFVSFFEDSYLLFTMPRFDYSFKKQLVSPKKIYSIDNGFSRANSASFSEDRGRMLENLVFVNLRRNYPRIFYFKEKSECDFVVKEKERITQAIQVCYELHEDNKEREIGGITDAMKKFKLKQGLVLTYDQEEVIDTQGKKIIVKPVWKWL